MRGNPPAKGRGGRQGVPVVTGFVIVQQQTHRIAFNTANLVARFTEWRFELHNWGKQHELTVARMNDREWAAICADIRQAGFEAAEVWVAHVDPSIGEAGARQRRKIADEHGLSLIGVAGEALPENFRVCQWLEIDRLNGGMWRCDVQSAESWARESRVHFNFENHPEKSADELRQKIAGGSEWVGLCIDTGWLGTQGLSAEQTIAALGMSLVRHVHVKDVRSAGGHLTTPLGEGCVDLDAAIAALRKLGYDGWYSWEDEPEDRNPFDTAHRDRAWLADRLSKPAG
jgi:sugar phosphate isomerase/epimerase